MLKRWLGIGVGALTALTAACDGAPMTQQVYVKGNGVISYLRYAAAEGPMLVQVHGNPFVTSKPYLDGVVAKEFEDTITYIRGVHLTTDPEKAFRPEYRIIVVLGAHKALDGQSLCDGEAPRMDTEADPMRMVAVFCRKTELLSWVNGSIRPDSSPDDTRFRNWLGQIGRDLINPEIVELWMFQRPDD